MAKKRTRRVVDASKNRKKNLVYSDGYIMNEHRVVFTKEERKALENAVAKANYRRRKQLQEWEKAPYNIGARQVAPDKTQLKLMGKEPDIIITAKSKSLQYFKTKEEYHNYMDYLEKVNSKDYLDQRVALYKENYIKSIETAINDKRLAQPIIDKIRTTNNKDFYRMALNNELGEISYIYGKDAKSKKVRELSKLFNVGMKDDQIEQIHDL